MPSGFATQFGILRCKVSAQRRPAPFDVSQTPFWSDEYRAIKGRSPGRRRLHWRSLKVSAGVVAIECGVLIAIET